MSSVNVIAMPPSTSPESASLTDELLMKVDTASPELETLSSLIAVNWLLAVKLLLPLSVRIEEPAPVKTGASFTAVTTIVKVLVELLSFGDILLPLSTTSTVTTAEPFASAAGV